MLENRWSSSLVGAEWSVSLGGGSGQEWEWGENSSIKGAQLRNVLDSDMTGAGKNKERETTPNHQMGGKIGSISRSY